MSRQSGRENKAKIEIDASAREASKSVVLSLIRRSNEAKTRMQSISGELGNEIKQAAENGHLHAGALKLIAKCARMNEMKRVAFLAAFDLYRTYAEECNLFGEEHVGDLVADAEVAPIGDIVAGNVEKLRRGIREKRDDSEPARAAR